jgi:predicted HTH transcriptional regulator
LAPVFKKLGIIEQWGNGLRLIADELKKYPEILLTWQEPGIAFIFLSILFSFNACVY